MAAIVTLRASPVITGLGTVSAAGLGVAALRGALLEARSRTTEIDRSAGDHAGGSARRALMVGQINLRDWIPPLALRRMSVPSRFGVVAARSALEGAGLDVPPEPDPSAAVAVSTVFGPSAFTQQFLDRVFENGPAAASPAVFTECVANAAAAQVAIHCRARGANHTIAGREAGVLMAIEQGASEIRGGARLVLAGAVEEMTPFVHSVLDRFRALSRPGSDREEAARPFDHKRDGFLAAEGGTIVVLENEIVARERGARILARVRSAFGGFDPSATPFGWGKRSDVLARRLIDGLRRSGLKPGDIDVIVSGASGSRPGDRLEAWTLKRAWREATLPPILAPKSVTGEYGGAFLAAAVMAASGERFGPTAGFEQVDPDLGLVPHDGSSIPSVRRLLVTSLASGGAAEWLVLERA